VAFCFAFSFASAIVMFDFAGSAHLNPAMLMSLWVRGVIDWKYFILLSLCEMAGGFLAALFVFLLYLPHFKTVPETAASSDFENLLRTRDSFDPQSLRIASYNTKQDASNLTFKGKLERLKYYLLSSNTINVEKTLHHMTKGTYSLHDIEVPFPETDQSKQMNTLLRRTDLIEEGLSESENKSEEKHASAKRNKRRRHSIQVSELHRRLHHFDSSILKPSSIEKNGNGR
jgi:hypothetical protein